MKRHWRLIEFDSADEEHEKMEVEYKSGLLMRIEYNAVRVIFFVYFS
jgi:hypothetical protein